MSARWEAAVAQEVKTLALDRTPVWPEVMDAVRHGLNSPVGLMYWFVHGPDGLRTQGHAAGMPASGIGPWGDDILAAGALTFDPMRISPRDANRVLTMSDLCRTGKISPTGRSDFERLGTRHTRVRVREQLRVLVAEGRTLLAWFGVLSDDPEAFDTRGRRSLSGLVPALRARLILERRLHDAPFLAAALETTLNSATESMYLVNEGGHVVLRNLAAESEPVQRLELIDAIRGNPSHFQVFPVKGKGFPPHWLAIRKRTPGSLLARLQAATRDWKLTPAEARVLALAARGLAVHAIARELESATRTVELHLTHLFRKARVESRTTLIASFWATRGVRSGF